VTAERVTSLEPLEPSALRGAEPDGSREVPTALGRPDSFREVDRTRARAAALGIYLGKQLSDPFSCVLPDHEGHDAALYTSGRGYWRYRCGEWSAGLGEVRASLGYKQPRRVNDADENARVGTTEVVMWSARLDYEAWLVKSRAVPHELPAEMSGAARAVARGVLLLLGLRDERWDTPTFTFTRRFGAAWCAVGEDTARRGIDELRRAGFLVLAGMQGRAFLWQLGEASA